MSAHSNTAVAAATQRPLRAKDIAGFLTSYKEAWETRNAELASSLFTRDARYHQDPFTAPIMGRDAIYAYWKSATGRQEDIHFAINNYCRKGYLLFAEWTCTYQHRTSGESREMAGMFIADFYGNQVRTFREYRLSRK